MSKDIRSYFTTLSKKTVVPEVSKPKKRSLTSLDSDDEVSGTPKDSNKSAKATDNARSKRRRIVEVSSDSETEHPPKKDTKNKPKTEKKIQENVKQKEKSVGKVKEKENKKLVNALAAFGDKPVKQSKVNKGTDRGTELNIHEDDDFDKTLLQLDEAMLLQGSAAARKMKHEPVPILSPPPPISFISPKTPSSAKKTVQRNQTSGDSEDGSGMDPDQERFEHKRYNSVMYQKYLNRSGPAHLGSKWIPKGRRNCLTGLSFIITGVLESMERDEAHTLIVEHGGRCTKSVSGKISYMVLGEDAGPAKVEKARKLGTKVITEDELIEMICVKSGIRNQNTPQDDSGDGKSNTTQAQTVNTRKQIVKSKHTEKRRINTIDDDDDDDGDDDGDDDENEIPKVTMKQQPTLKEQEPTSTNSSSSSSRSRNSEIKQKKQKVTIKTKPVYELAWVDKYKPTDVDQIIGQQGEKSVVKKLTKWLKNWYHNNNGKTIVSKPSPWAKDDDGAYFKAALISGPPGIGKTTTATLVSKQLGFDVVEFNASDTRNKQMVHDEISSLLKTTSLAAYFSDGSAPTNRHVLLMDEVDGMSGNEDRGGIQELISLIKGTRVPIICLCNDRYHTRIRSLANYCYDLRFAKPRLQQIRGAMMSVCFKEGVKINGDALTQIIEATDMDVRQTLHHLSMWNGQGAAPLSVEQATQQAHGTLKDVRLGPWDVIRKVFSDVDHRTMSLSDRYNLFFYDYNIAPLFVHENYVKVKPMCAKENTLQRVAAAADCISLGDLVNTRIRSTQDWSLLPLEAMYASVLPGHYMRGQLASPVTFPIWLGKHARTNKIQRMLQELKVHTLKQVTGGQLALNLDYLPHLRDAVVRPLARHGTAGIPSALDTMKAYSLLRDDLSNILELSRWPKTKDPFESGVDSKVKAAFTRAYNKMDFMLPYSIADNITKKKRSASQEVYRTQVGEESEEDEKTEPEVTADAMIKVKQSKKPKAVKPVVKVSKAKAPVPAKPRGGNKKAK